MEVLAVTALELCQMPGGHRENWKSSQRELEMITEAQS